MLLKDMNLDELFKYVDQYEKDMVDDINNNVAHKDLSNINLLTALVSRLAEDIRLSLYLNKILIQKLKERSE